MTFTYTDIMKRVIHYLAKILSKSSPPSHNLISKTKFLKTSDLKVQKKYLKNCITIKGKVTNSRTKSSIKLPAKYFINGNINEKNKKNKRKKERHTP